MNDQESKIITDIFKRLEQTAAQQRDPDAEKFIADKVKAQPYAPYAMAQSLYVQEEAMKSLNQQLEQLKAENEQLRQQPKQSGGIFSSIFGGSQQPQQPPPLGGRPGQPNYAPQGYPQQQGGPWGGQPQQGGPWGGPQQAQAPASGGFLKSALTTAAGVAGGMVVGNALMNAFSGHSHSTLGSFSNTDVSSMGFGDALSPSGSTGFQDASFSDGGSVFSDSGLSSPSVQDAGFTDGSSVWDSGDAATQDASFDDGGSDFGGSDDSSWT